MKIINFIEFYRSFIDWSVVDLVLVHSGKKRNIIKTLKVDERFAKLVRHLDRKMRNSNLAKKNNTFKPELLFYSLSILVSMK